MNGAEFPIVLQTAVYLFWLEIAKKWDPISEPRNM